MLQVILLTFVLGASPVSFQEQLCTREGVRIGHSLRPLPCFSVLSWLLAKPAHLCTPPGTLAIIYNRVRQGMVPHRERRLAQALPLPGMVHVPQCTCS